MRLISILALIIAFLSLVAGVYCQLTIVPRCEASSIHDGYHIYFRDLKFLFGMIALFGGITAALLGIISGIKKEKIGWIAFLISITPIILGLLQATHMFS
jgi:hypothetical protein